MMHVRLKVALTLVGPILTRASARGPLGVDAVAARTRDPERRLYLPFSLVKGRLKQAWEEIGLALSPALDGSVRSRRLGAGSATGSHDPLRGELYFSDFIHAGPNGHGRLHRIRIDSDRSAADEGALQVIESPIAVGQQAEFRGEIEFFAADATQSEQIRKEIEAGLRWVPSFGGERAVGFGRLAKVKVDLRATSIALESASANSGSDTDHSSCDLVIDVKDLFCVARRQPNQNLFESEAILSGAVLKGAVASAINALLGRTPGEPIDRTVADPLGALGRNFDQLRFTHAFPAKGDALLRPVVLPLSLVKGGGTWCDVALLPGPGLIGNPPRAPVFSIDWKESDDVRDVWASFGWTEPKRELRVRTKIDWEQRRAEDEKLFAYEMIVPEGFKWLARLDLSRVAPGERGAVMGQLRRILEAVPVRIGKTKARANIAVQSSGTVQPRFPSQPGALGDRWVVSLQTPTLLVDPHDLHGGSGEVDLHAAYEAAWKDLHGGYMNLERFFASQSLFGGYLVSRFQKGSAYNPFLLTDAGSVFVFALAEGTARQDAEGMLGQWLAQGLPLPTWAKARYADDWRTCPFRPQEGFGEISVNLPCHHGRRPEVFHAI
jgi:hypothetical protein